VCVLLLEAAADKTVAWVVPLYGTLKGFVFVTVLCWRGPVRPSPSPALSPLHADGVS